MLSIYTLDPMRSRALELYSGVKSVGKRATPYVVRFGISSGLVGLAMFGQQLITPYTTHATQPTPTAEAKQTVPTVKDMVKGFVDPYLRDAETKGLGRGAAERVNKNLTGRDSFLEALHTDVHGYLEGVWNEMLDAFQTEVYKIAASQQQIACADAFLRAYIERTVALEAMSSEKRGKLDAVRSNRSLSPSQRADEIERINRIYDGQMSSFEKEYATVGRRACEEARKDVNYSPDAVWNEFITYAARQIHGIHTRYDREIYNFPDRIVDDNILRLSSRELSPPAPAATPTPRPAPTSLEKVSPTATTPPPTATPSIPSTGQGVDWGFFGKTVGTISGIGIVGSGIYYLIRKLARRRTRNRVLEDIDEAIRPVDLHPSDENHTDDE